MTQAAHESLGTRTDLFIGGEWRAGSTGDSIEVLDPGTGRPVAVVASGSPDDAVAAVSAAAAAQPEWAARPPRDRSEVLRECWRLIHVHADELARLLVSEQGKPLAEARGELDYAAEFFRWNAEETVRIGGRFAPTPSGVNRVLVSHHPVGVVVMVTPWNFPAAMITRKVAPALGAGNAVVIKPAAETPLTALYLGELMTRAGVPAGVVNIVPSNRPGDWFDAADRPSGDAHDLVHRLDAGRSRAARQGIGPGAQVDDGARRQRPVRRAGRSRPRRRHRRARCTPRRATPARPASRPTGSSCTSRWPASSPTDSPARWPRCASAPGSNRTSQCGPVISAAAADRLDRTVKEAIAAGAQLVTGGSRPPRDGFFFEPTVLTDVPPDAAILDQELFGPVAPIVTFSDVDEMVERANATEMGLAGYVFGPELGRGLAVAERLQVGMVGLNRGYASDPSAPFGGMKQSGLGREGGLEGIYDFCETQFVATGW